MVLAIFVKHWYTIVSELDKLIAIQTSLLVVVLVVNSLLGIGTLYPQILIRPTETVFNILNFSKTPPPSSHEARTGLSLIIWNQEMAILQFSNIDNEQQPHFKVIH